MSKIPGNTAKILQHEGFQPSLSVGDKVPKKNMANESCRAKMKTKWTGSYITVEVTPLDGI